MRPSSEEARHYDHVTIDCMSDESSESENEDMTVLCGVPEVSTYIFKLQLVATI